MADEIKAPESETPATEDAVSEVPVAAEEPVGEEISTEDTPAEEAAPDTENKPSLLERVNTFCEALVAHKATQITDKVCGALAILAALVSAYLGIVGFWFDVAHVALWIAVLTAAVPTLLGPVKMYVARGKGRAKRHTRTAARNRAILFVSVFVCMIFQLTYSQIPHRDGRYGGFWHTYDGIYYDVVTAADGTETIKVCDADVDAEIVLIPEEVRGIPVTEVHAIAFAYSPELTEFKTATNNEYFSVRGGVLYNKDCTTLICYPRGKRELNRSFATSATTIAPNAFRNNGHLETVELPNATTICEQAFMGAVSLKRVELSDNLTTIRWEAFADCKQLQIVNIPASVTLVERGAFSGFSATQTIVIYADTTGWNAEWKYGSKAVVRVGE